MRIQEDLDGRHPSPPTALDGAARPLATWPTRRPWPWAIAVGLGGTLLTAFGVAFGQVRQLDVTASTYAQAAFVAVSALVGLVIMWRTRPLLADYGFRRPLNLGRTLWVLPLVAVPLILVAFTGVTVTPAQAAAYGVLSVAVGFNEEIWFRGLLLAALRRLGTRPAIIGASAVFGALHLTNFFAGRPPLYLALQFAFACLVGLALAQLVTITGSLWIGIAWHFVYDFAAMSTSDDVTTGALAGLAAITAALLAYAVWLWRGLPSDDPAVIPAS